MADIIFPRMNISKLSGIKWKLKMTDEESFKQMLDNSKDPLKYEISYTGASEGGLRAYYTIYPENYLIDDTTVPTVIFCFSGDTRKLVGATFMMK